VTYWQFSRAV